MFLIQIFIYSCNKKSKILSENTKMWITNLTIYQFLESSGDGNLIYSMEKSSFGGWPKCEAYFQVLLLHLGKRGRAYLAEEVENVLHCFPSTVFNMVSGKKIKKQNFLLDFQLGFKEVSLRGHEPVEMLLSFPQGLEISHQYDFSRHSYL